MPDDGSTYRPPVLDINNRNMTPSGSSGWGAADAEDLGRITGIRFMLNFDKRVGPFRIPFRGNIPFRCWVVDSESAVWHQDFSYSLLGTNQEVRLDFSNFTRLHSRAPVEVENAILNVILPELRTAPGFNSRTIKLVGLHLLDNYDESGRYWPFFSPWNNLFEFGGRAITNSPVDHIGTVDGLAFIKSPIAVANEGPGENSAPAGRTIAAPITERPNISNYVQLKAATEALADLNAWRLDNYTIRVPGRVDVLAESSIVLKDPRLISEEDVSGQPGTLKLTVTRVSWSVTADFRGWYTEMTCYRRINRGAVT